LANAGVEHEEDMCKDTW